MTAFMSPLPFEDAELAYLKEALGDRSLASAVGMLAAVVSVPEILPSQLWLGELMKGIAFKDAEHAQRFADLIMRLNNYVARAFAEGDPTRICPSDGDDSDFGWDDDEDRDDDEGRHDDEDRDHDRGAGEGLRDEFDAANAEFCTAYVSIIRAFGIDTESNGALKLLGQIARGEEKAWSMAHDFDAILGSLYAWWHPRKPSRRESPKIGRNDRCHCGSGKKFKKCHGAAA